LRIRSRLIVLIITVSLLPLVILGLGATQVSVERLTEKVADSQARSVDQLASEIDLWLQLQASLVADQVDAFRLGRLDERKLKAFQRLAFQQLSDVNIVAIVNSDGQELVPSLFLDGEQPGALASKDVVDIARLTAFREALPITRMESERERWRASGGESRPAVVGTPYTPEGRSNPVLPVVIPDGPESPLYLAVELSMERFGQRFQRAAQDGLSVALLNAAGEVTLSTGAPIIEASKFRPFQPSTAAAEVVYTREDGNMVLGACAPVPGTGWLVAVGEPMSVITDAGDEIRNRTAFISLVAAILSLLLGLLVSGGIATRLTRVRNAALSVAEGDLGRTVKLEGASEIRDLSRAFNFMSRRLASNQSRIAEQQGEIEAFNEELKRQLVAQEERLVAANRAVLQSGRLAAVGEMGAGLAHELNNPLAGILGLVQVLQIKTPSSQLSEIEEQALRCSRIVKELLKFSPSKERAIGTQPETWGRVGIKAVVEDVCGLLRVPFGAAGIEILEAVNPAFEVRGDAEALSAALIQLLNSLRSACKGSGRLKIASTGHPGQVHIELTLSGETLDGQSDDWKAAGMGFWLARKVFADHGGELIEPNLAPDARSGTWTIRIPLV